jgi:hypothetical protein
LVDRTRREVARLETDGLFTRSDAKGLDDLFEKVARRVLRRPSPIERSVMLRRFVRRCIPAPMRPVVLRVVRHVIARTRAVRGALARRR